LSSAARTGLEPRDGTVPTLFKGKSCGQSRSGAKKL
jgi:hypothetical protein